MNTPDDATPEALLKRAMDALTVAEAKATQLRSTIGQTQAWAQISRAASEAGQLALDILTTQPRTKETPQPQFSIGCRDRGCTDQDHTYSGGCLLYPNRLSTTPTGDPEEALQLLRSTISRDVEDLSYRENIEDEVQALEQTINDLRQVLVAMLLRQKTTLDYVPGSVIRQASLWELHIERSSADGAVTFRISRNEDNQSGEQNG